MKFNQNKIFILILSLNSLPQSIFGSQPDIDMLTKNLHPAIAHKVRFEMDHEYAKKHNAQNIPCIHIGQKNAPYNTIPLNENKINRSMQSINQRSILAEISAKRPPRLVRQINEPQADIFERVKLLQAAIASSLENLNRIDAQQHSISYITTSSQCVKTSTLGFVAHAVSKGSQEVMRHHARKEESSRFFPVDPVMIASLAEKASKPLLLGSMGLVALFTVERWITAGYRTELKLLKKSYQEEKDRLAERIKDVNESIVQAKHAINQTTGNIAELRKGYEAMQSMLHQNILPKIELIMLQVVNLKDDMVENDTNSETNKALQDQFKNLRVEISAQPDEHGHYSTEMFKKQKTTPSPKQHNPLHGLLKFVNKQMSPSHEDKSKPNSKTK